MSLLDTAKQLSSRRLGFKPHEIDLTDEVLDVILAAINNEISVNAASKTLGCDGQGSQSHAYFFWRLLGFAVERGKLKVTKATPNENTNETN